MRSVCGLKLLIYAACMRPYATNICALTLLIYAACMRPHATNICGLRMQRVAVDLSLGGLDVVYVVEKALRLGLPASDPALLVLFY
jgi:hypothetical protein